MASTTGRPGRKPKAPNPGQRASLGLKVTPEIKRKLDLAAQANGRTQSQEAEVRLENSFRDERLMVDAMVLVYGRRLTGLLLELGDLLSEVGRHVGFEVTGSLVAAENWLSDPKAYDEAVKAAMDLLEALRPPGAILPMRNMTAPPGTPDLQKVLDVMATSRGAAAARGHAALLTGEQEIGGAAGERTVIKRELLGHSLIERLRSATKTAEEESKSGNQPSRPPKPRRAPATPRLKTGSK
jgi:TraY domain-containing protein